ncbi:MAG: sulfatase-like hydrolase/transferase, partial [Paraglaciecola sp.]|nr:sulfatase-like hydrolase/transferase [Paraglaciecola sp.]
EKAVTFIKENKQGPFFLYLAHAMPHVPLFASEEFTGRSTQGMYGDVMEELDWSVGKILRTLREQGIAENTLVVFSSDNGPWLLFKTMGGSAGLLRGGKNETFEGGLRVPALFWWPGHIQPSLVHDIGSTIDLLPTLVSLAGGKSHENSDSYDLSATLLAGKTGIRDEYFYYRGEEIYAVRKGKYKAHFLFKEAYGNPQVIEHQHPILYDLHADPGEKYDVAKEHPEVVIALQKMRTEQIASVKPVVNQLNRCKKGSRFCP